MAYRHLLLATDFSQAGTHAATRASDLARRYQAELSIIHVVENLPLLDSSFGPTVPFDAELSDRIVAAARNRLAALADQLGIPEQRRWIELDSATAEIIRVAREQEVDLIVVGSHGRHGLGLLLGSTASAIVHHAGCDVLAVRLPG